MENEVYLSTLLLTYPLPFLIRTSFNLLAVNKLLQGCIKDRQNLQNANSMLLSGKFPVPHSAKLKSLS
jgi:hypothetical protein